MALQNALLKGPILKLGSECDKTTTQDHSDCSSTSASSQAGSDESVATSDSKDSSSDASSVADSNSANNLAENAKDDLSETRNNTEGGNQVTTLKPSLLIPSENHPGEDRTEAPAKESPPAPAPAPNSEISKPVEAAIETAQKAVKSTGEPELDFSRVSESASHPRAKDETSAKSVAKKLSKDAKSQRSAALKKKREERKKEHEEQVEDLMEEISHQREVLRSRRDQKKQKQKLQALQKQLERLCQKELDDDEYLTSDDEEDAEEETSPEEATPTAEAEDKDTKDNDDDSAKSESESATADGDKESEPEDTNAWPTVSSKAKQEWEERKKSRDEFNSHLDGIMDFIGLESVKAKMLEIKTLVDTARRQEVNLSKERFNTVLVGNSGTGKTSLAKHYAKFLSSLELAEDNLATSSGSKLVYEGINELKNTISQIDERGVVFIDDAHILRPDISSTGRKVLDYLVTEMDRLQGQVIFIFTGKHILFFSRLPVFHVVKCSRMHHFQGLGSVAVD